MYAIVEPAERSLYSDKYTIPYSYFAKKLQNGKLSDSIVLSSILHQNF